MDNTESLWKIFDNISELIRFSDAKATAILATDGVIAGFYFANISTVIDIVKIRPIAFLPLVFALGCILISAWQTADCLFPRLKGSTTCSTVFFCDIVKAHKSPHEYHRAISKAFANDNAKLNEELSFQIWQISQVAKCKYNSVKQSIAFLVASLGSSILIILITAWS